MQFPINVLCQSPVSTATTPAQAIANTLDLARSAEALGYHRFWVAEHHSDQALASASPEIMVAAVAAATTRIRVGSGGVLLPYYGPLKVAEQFNTLAALHPRPNDLGLGRSGGSEGHAPQALGARSTGHGTFAAIDELLSWLGAGSPKRPFADTFASPRLDADAREQAAQPWILGTSAGSARFAAQRGLPYAFGGFLDPRGMGDALTAYHQSFAPNASGAGPRVNLAWNVLAADTPAEARHLARTTEHWFVRTMLRGENPPFECPDQIADATYSPSEQRMLEVMRQMALIGSAAQVVDRMRGLMRATLADELTLVTIPFAHAARVRSYELIAQAW